MKYTEDIESTLQDIAESIELNEARLEKIQSSYNGILSILKKDEQFFSKYEDRIKMELYYSVKMSFWLDIRILFHTFV